jgi:hypothetical protein
MIKNLLCSGHSSGEARSSFSRLSKLSSKDVRGISSDAVWPRTKQIKFYNQNTICVVIEPSMKRQQKQDTVKVT